MIDLEQLWDAFDADQRLADAAGILRRPFRAWLLERGPGFQKAYGVWGSADLELACRAADQRAIQLRYPWRTGTR